MKLYHNADILDLESILAKGLIPLSKSGNNKWADGRRGNNSTDCVYLFKPVGSENSFTNYGAVLIEVEVEDATVSQMAENDAHINDYVEYTVPEVSVENIKHIFIPEIFRERLSNGKLIVNEKPKFDAPYTFEMGSNSPEVESFLIAEEGTVVTPILSENVLNKITWCGISAEVYDYKRDVNIQATADSLQQFAKTAKILSAEASNFFRGIDTDKKMIDLCNVNYVF